MPAGLEGPMVYGDSITSGIAESVYGVLTILCSQEFGTYGLISHPAHCPAQTKPPLSFPRQAKLFKAEHLRQIRGCLFALDAQGFQRFPIPAVIPQSAGGILMTDTSVQKPVCHA